MLHGEVASLYMVGHVSVSHLAKLSFSVSTEQTSNPIWMAAQDVAISSAICSSAPHSQNAAEPMPHLRLDDRKRPTPVQRRFSRTQAGLGSPISGRRASTSSKNECRQEVSSRHPMLHLWSAHLAALVPSSLASLSSSRAAGTKGCRWHKGVSMPSIRVAREPIMK